jgi:hypothetical protein
MTLEQVLILKFDLAFLEGLHQVDHITLLPYCFIEEMAPHPAVLSRLRDSQAVHDGKSIVRFFGNCYSILVLPDKRLKFSISSHSL